MKKLRITIVLHLIFLLKAGSQVPIYNSFDELSPHIALVRDTTLVINFWASWCRPCLEELPHFEKISKELQEKPVKFLLVNLDDPGILQSRVIPLLERLAINIPCVLLNDTDYNSWIDRVDPSWSGAIPGTLILNEASRSFFEKSLTYIELKQIIHNKL